MTTVANRVHDTSTSHHDERADHTPARGSTDARDRLARFMFDLQADSYDAVDAMRELAWADDGIRDFWVGQAGAVVSFLGLEAA